MRFVLAIGAALTVAFPAAAAEPFDSFRSFCLETQGKTEAAVAVALGKKILNESGLAITAADDLDDAAQKIVAAVG